MAPVLHDLRGAVLVSVGAAPLVEVDPAAEECYTFNIAEGVLGPGHGDLWTFSA